MYASIVPIPCIEEPINSWIRLPRCKLIQSCFRHWDMFLAYGPAIDRLAPDLPMDHDFRDEKSRGYERVGMSASGKKARTLLVTSTCLVFASALA